MRVRIPGAVSAAGWPARSAIMALVLVCGASGAGIATAQDQPAVVQVDRARLLDLSETTPVIAQLVPTTQSAVATRTAGIVDRVMFRVGDRVEKGQELVRLDANLLDILRRTVAASLDVARAGVQAAQARVQLAAQAFERQSQLRGSTAFSKGQFEDLQQNAEQARSELARAVAQVAQAEAELAAADYNLRNASIHAPFSGVVVARMAQPGSYIALGDAVATLLDISGLEIEVDMPAQLMGAIMNGKRLAAVFEGGETVEATVRSLLPVEAVSTRTRPVRLSFDLAALDPARLAAGKSLILRVPVEAPREALMVPKDALVQANDGGWTVVTVEDGKAVRRPVAIGRANGSWIEVTSGLLPGDAVVIRGNERLRPGQPVEPVFVTSDPPALASGTADRG